MQTSRAFHLSQIIRPYSLGGNVEFLQLTAAVNRAFLQHRDAQIVTHQVLMPNSHIGTENVAHGVNGGGKVWRLAGLEWR